MSGNIKKNSKIVIDIGLDDKNVPTTIHWQSTDNPNGNGAQECKAFLLSVFDKEYKDTLKIDLWTKEMEVAEMDRLMYQTLRALGDTYFKATNNGELANHMQAFVDYFGQKTGIIPPDEETPE